jgi:hypothetical protein
MTLSLTRSVCSYTQWVWGRMDRHVIDAARDFWERELDRAFELKRSFRGRCVAQR